MPANQKIGPSSSNRSSTSGSAGMGDANMEVLELNSFKLKPIGTGATRNTLVENDSLSSYSWPEETNCQNGEPVQQPDEGESHKRLQDARGNLKHGENVILSKKSHTVIDIELDNEPFLEPTYIGAYLKFMYWTCVSPFNPETNCHGPRSACDLALKITQKTLFSTIVGFSMLMSFCQVKFNLIYYMTYSDMESFIDMMLYIMYAGTKVYYVYLFVVLRNHFSQMLNDLQALRVFRMQNFHCMSKNNCSKMSYAVKLGISSMILTFIQTILYSGVRQWTPQKSLWTHSHSTALGLFLWSKENMGNETWFLNLKYEYASEINNITVILGVFGLTMHFCSFWHNEATGDMMQTQAETVREEMKCLQTQINKTENDEENSTLVGFFRGNGEWTHSRLLTQAINSCNNTLDPIMKYKHVNNLMLYVFFVLNFLDGDYSVAFLAYLLYDICKTSYTYRIAAEASTLNESKVEWIRRLAWKSKDEEFLKRVPLLLDEIRGKPIGMGNGQFLINESFLYRFLGWVGSVFVLQAQSRETKEA